MHARRLKKRETMLLELKKLIWRFQTEISYTARELDGLIAENRDLLFCRLAAEDKNLHGNPGEALKNTGKGQFENRQDEKLFVDFVRGLGTSDTQGQLHHIALHAQLLEERLALAAQDYTKRARLFVGLGLFAGITICILLV